MVKAAFIQHLGLSFGSLHLPCEPPYHWPGLSLDSSSSRNSALSAAGIKRKPSTQKDESTHSPRCGHFDACVTSGGDGEIAGRRHRLCSVGKRADRGRWVGAAIQKREQCKTEGRGSEGGIIWAVQVIQAPKQRLTSRQQFCRWEKVLDHVFEGPWRVPAYSRPGLCVCLSGVWSWRLTWSLWTRTTKTVAHGNNRGTLLSVATSELLLLLVDVVCAWTCCCGLHFSCVCAAQR